MNLQQQGMLALIKSALTGKAHPIPETFDIVAAATTAKQHEIIPLFCEGVRVCGLKLSSELSQKLFLLCCQYIAYSEGQLFELSSLIQEFIHNGIDHLPLKGAVLKKMYPKAEFRRMGDADILIKEEQYNAIKPILLKLGYEYDYETDHEIVWKKPSLVLELHKKLIPERNEDFYEYFSAGWDLAIQEENNCYHFSNENMMIYLFTHFAKHYRTGGIGINHVIDLWIYKSKSSYDANIVTEQLDKLGLSTFYNNVMCLLDVWFEDSSSTEITDFITNVIFDSGVYGTHDAHLLAYSLIAEKRGRKNKFLNKLLYALFPSAKSLEVKYPVLKKHSYLLPFVWFVRIVDVLFFNRGKISKTRDAIKISTKQRVDEFKSALNYVGLDFNFREQNK